MSDHVVTSKFEVPGVRAVREGARAFGIRALRDGL